MSSDPSRRRFLFRSGARSVVVAVLFLAGACSGPEPGAPQPKPVRVAAVQAAPGAAPIRYSAVVEPARQAFVAFEIGGRVVALAARQGADGHPRDLQAGDRVAKGEIVARLASEQPADRNLQAKAQLAEASAGRDKAHGDLDRARALYEARSLTRPDFDAATAAAAAADARFAAAEAALDAAGISLADAALAAPWAGVVLERRIEVGQLAAPGSTGIVLADLGEVKALFGVPEEVVGRLAPGDSLPVRFDGPAGLRTGRVTALSPAADLTTRVFTVEVTLDNGDGLLRPGTVATVAVPGDSAASGLAGRPLVPFAAVVRGRGEEQGYAVLVVDSEPEPRAHARAVRLGEVVGSSVVVEAGLELGELVVVSSPALLTDGDAVRVIP